MDTIITNQEQTQRKKHLLDLTEIFHRSHYGDYDDRFDDFAATYLGTIMVGAYGEIDKAPPKQPIPKYASCAEDETYGMINVYKTLGEALSHQSSISSNGETLNVPAGVYDLDTGERIETYNVTMTAEAFAVLCGFVQPSRLVNINGIFTNVWEELRETFPLDYFKKAVAERGEEFYDEDAGL